MIILGLRVHQIAVRQPVLRLLRVIMGTAVMSLGAPLALSLSWSPVPLSIHPALCILLSMLMGRAAGWSMLLFVLEGTLGAPVFAGCSAGWGVLVGPTGGYLIGYILAATCTGWAFERLSLQRVWQRWLTICLGSSIILGCGALHLQQWVGWEAAWLQGIVPFLIGDLIFRPIVLESLRSGYNRYFLNGCR